MTVSSPIINVGVIGCGHWGPNHIRVFSQLNRSSVVACADLNRPRLERMKSRFPRLETTTDYHDLLNNEDIDAIVIATPTQSHVPIAREALNAQKHVLAEKPLGMTVSDVYELDDLARAKKLVLMTGHVFLYNNGITRLREAIESDDLGPIHYLDAIRTNLGPIRGDVNALFDLGTHDISIFNYLLDATPVEVAAHGACISQKSIEDVCFATLKYPDGTLGHIHVSWLNPRKVRTLTVVGKKKMAHWDDVDPEDTLRFYDKGFDEPPYYDSFGDFQYLLRNADVHLPNVERAEPLTNQANAFLDSILDGAPCRSGGRESAAVVAVLEAATESLENRGRMCPVKLSRVGQTVTRERESIMPVRAGVPIGQHPLTSAITRR